MREKERERVDRKRERKLRERDRQTDKQTETDRQTDREKGGQKERDRQTDRQTDSYLASEGIATEESLARLACNDVEVVRQGLVAAHQADLLAVHPLLVADLPRPRRPVQTHHHLPAASLPAQQPERKVRRMLPLVMRTRQELSPSERLEVRGQLQQGLAGCVIVQGFDGTAAQQ